MDTSRKVCFDCFRRLFPGRVIRKVTLGRECTACHTVTVGSEQMVPIESEG
ncbi:Uncharacterised protein [Mycolicibacterium tokaiense]|uniref:Uncharacterized protein n=1 Tax=Mycolicibacterium tokaiense TaxID=39695 RepID=A0A378TNF3_9MYCO|nr:Uncharacterised protein [Mycolicibacterium tokaiense]